MEMQMQLYPELTIAQRDVCVRGCMTQQPAVLAPGAGAGQRAFAETNIKPGTLIIEKITDLYLQVLISLQALCGGPTPNLRRAKTLSCTS